MAVGQKRVPKKTLLAKGKIDQNLLSLWVFFLTYSHVYCSFSTEDLQSPAKASPVSPSLILRLYQKTQVRTMCQDIADISRLDNSRAAHNLQTGCSLRSSKEGRVDASFKTLYMAMGQKETPWGPLVAGSIFPFTNRVS